ncbi:FHA domain-containing protein [Cnuibacter physcomitrellae]|uniref:FHA domain-containing protein n=1 Tax=Cnuibacter physcomitrellae TaxID=1619308 RepID=UPI0021758C7A|nr:FHA domain-containing protein [Cnuibacter physcomitrellae]MCS5498747.1 FHA domain-containing protein [Cnuibacter physcomitrellae]
MTLTEGALLCGECGTSALAPAPTLGDTARYDRRALRRSIAAQAAQAGRAAGLVPTAGAPRHAELPTTAIPTVERTREPAAPSPSASAPAPAPAPAASHSADAVDPRVFSLAFSTGDTVRVSGHGLVGRNPTPAEGESFDYLVQIVDPDRSMSKTHLEFGVAEDGFWILDRGSANGTRIVEGDEVVDLDPGLRVVIYRGLRVELGDQYFDLH